MLDHQKVCLYQKFKCPNRCFEKDPENCPIEKSFGKDLENHLKVCPFETELCQTCGLGVLRRRKAVHNCFKEYKKLLVNQENEVKYLKSNYGANLDI